MSRAQLCDDTRSLRRLNESNASCFRKRLTSLMLKKNERVEVPRGFVRKHGDRFHGELSLTGPNGKSRSVPLKVRHGGRRTRAYLARGWTDFVKENGFQLGDEVTFWLVASSSFRVELCSPQFREKATSVINISSDSDDEADETSDDGAITSAFAPLAHPKLARQAVRKGTPGSSIPDHEETQIPACYVNSNAVESQVPTCSVEAVPQAQKRTSKVRVEDYVHYPGLNAAVTANSRFPQFVRKLSLYSFSHNRRRGPEIPGAFLKEHGDKIRERVTLLGASDHLRVLNLEFSISTEYDRVYLGKGWKDFSLENGYAEGDVLLFSLVGDSTFVVKMFPGVT